MRHNPEFLINIFTSFTYSWVPALLILWFLIARKPNSKLLPPLVGFITGTILSIWAGHLNHLSSLKLFPGDESPQFFFAVGFVEELIKFIASAGSLLLLYSAEDLMQFLGKRKEPKQIPLGIWRQDYQLNWLAQSLSGALGFAAAENFIYGIDGQGGIARIIPLVAHTGFAVFWGLGLYKASFSINPWKGLMWVLVGLLEGILLHGFYDCIVSENVIPDTWKIVAWLAMGVLITLLLIAHLRIIKKLKEEQTENLFPEENIANKEIISNNEKVSKIWLILSIVSPGAGHLFKRKEFFNGLTFFALSLLLPYLVLRFSLNEVAGRLISAQGTGELKLLHEIIRIVSISVASYLTIGFWSAWELNQSSTDIDHKDSKRRLTAFFPVSTLFFISLMTSFFLPVLDKQKNKEQGDDKNTVIKEIPLGITWEMEKVPPAQQLKKNTEVGTKEAINSITIDRNPDKKPDKKDEKKQPDPSKDKPPSGVQNSDSLNRENMPSKLPKIGYIGVKLAEALFNNQMRPYVYFVYPGTSADRAGLKAGDLILYINGKSSTGLNAFEVSNLVRGPLGTSVDLIVYRPGEGEKIINAYRTGTVFANETGPEPLLKE
jgi:RsiW-degrading membrane proteinase PrsW (M82 family)